MRRSLLHPAAALVLLLCVSSQASAQGIALHWQNCEADGGLSNVAFACNTNAGFAALVPSFTVDSDVVYVTNVRGIVDIVSQSAALPAWWEFQGCRNGSITALQTAIGPTLCSFWAAPFLVNEGVSSFVIGGQGPNTARLEFLSSVGQPGRVLSPGTEYIALALRINFARTVGTGACDSCATGVCLTLTQVGLGLVTGTNDILLTTPFPTPDGAHVTWQGGGPGGTCDGVVAARRSAWGAIKSLYR